MVEYPRCFYHTHDPQQIGLICREVSQTKHMGSHLPYYDNHSHYIFQHKLQLYEDDRQIN